MLQSPGRSNLPGNPGWSTGSSVLKRSDARATRQGANPRPINGRNSPLLRASPKLLVDSSPSRGIVGSTESGKGIDDEKTRDSGVARFRGCGGYGSAPGAGRQGAARILQQLWRYHTGLLHGLQRNVRVLRSLLRALSGVSGSLTRSPGEQTNRRSSSAPPPATPATTPSFPSPSAPAYALACRWPERRGYGWETSGAPFVGVAGSCSAHLRALRKLYGVHQKFTTSVSMWSVSRCCALRAVSLSRKTQANLASK